MKNPSRTELWTAFGSYDVMRHDFSNLSILDVAWHLAQANRYNGACAQPYSVAQHCLLVAQVLPAEYKFAGLMHDVTETVLGDIVSPFKHVLTEYRLMEAACMRQAEKHFGLPEDALEHPLVRQADRQVMAAEMTSDFLHWDALHLPPRAPVRLEPSSWERNRDMFAACFTFVVMRGRTRDSKHFLQHCLNVFTLYGRGALTREEACLCGRGVNALMRGEENDVLDELFSRKNTDEQRIVARADYCLRCANVIMTTPCLLQEETKNSLSFSEKG